MGFWTEIGNGILNLFLQPNCPLCDRTTHGDVLCSSCTNSLQRLQFKNPARWWSQSSQVSSQLPVFIWGKYQGQLKQAIAALKYNNHPEIARPLGLWLGEAWNKSAIAGQHSLIVIPIPLHPEKLKQRGFNQAENLAVSFCQATNLKLSSNGLIRLRNTEAQFGKSADERQANVQNAFAVTSDFLSRYRSFPVLLLDDIHTTGATVQAAAQALRHQGLSVYGVVAIATTNHS